MARSRAPNRPKIKRFRWPIVGGLLAALVMPGVAWACLWDNETIEQEDYRFPTAVELMAGLFPRHSPAFHEWRIADREARLSESPDQLDLYDDIAVSYDKLGQPERAIEWMLEKQSREPGLYTTLANLGTFYIHNGQYEEGLGYIRQALEVNPEAHFGREEYQLYLVEYVVLRQQHAGGRKLPLSSATEGQETEDPLRLAIESERARQLPKGFAAYLDHRLNEQGRQLDQPEAEKAVTGILGIMRFGNHASPVVLEALGDLLAELSASQLATQAYLRASHVVDDEIAASAYRDYASAANIGPYAMVNPEDFVNQLESALLEKVAEGDDFYAEITGNEEFWIREDLDVEQLYRTTYMASLVTESLEPQQRQGLLLVAIGLIVAGVAAAAGTWWLQGRFKPLRA